MRISLFLLGSLLAGLSPIVNADSISVKEIDNRIQGFTQTWALEYLTDLRPGQVFDNEASLGLRLEQIRQELWNKRYYKTLDVHWEKVQPDSARVIFEGVETYTILPLPFYSYDSNLGHKYGAVLFYENFLGSLTSLFVSAGRDEQNWDINTRFTGIKLLNMGWNLAYRQWWKTEEKKLGDRVVLKYSWDTTDFSINTGIPLFWGWGMSLSFSALGKYNLQPRVAEPGFGYPVTGWNYGTGVGFGVGQKNWDGNFRKGADFGIGAGFGVDPLHGTIQPSFSSGASWFSLWGPVNILTSVGLSWTPFGEITGAASNVRGVEDSLLWGDRVATYKSGAGFTLFNIPDWVEVQLWGFFDATLALQEGRDIGLDQLGLGSGAEILIFPHFFKSFIFRATLGFDLQRPGKIEWVVVDGLSM